MLNSKFSYAIDNDSSLTVLLNAMDSPTANDPGAVTLAFFLDPHYSKTPGGGSDDLQNRESRTGVPFYDRQRLFL